MIIKSRTRVFKVDQDRLYESKKEKFLNFFERQVWIYKGQFLSIPDRPQVGQRIEWEFCIAGHEGDEAQMKYFMIPSIQSVE